jgi:DGQHR domain-containing protein
MSDNNYISFKCIQVIQPIGKFYIGAIGWNDLLAVSYADRLRIEKERDVEEYLGIQRPLLDYRVAEIKEYVRNIDATFPTSIIIAVSSEDASYHPQSSTMKMRRDRKVAKIIDGQHRIAGLEGYHGSPFELNVTVFVDMDIEDQALVFATINLKQTKVSKSLAYSLYEYATSRSPQKTCHNIAKLLNSKQDSPFNNKIKILGVATGKPEESLTQATFVERLIPYVSDDPMKDRDLIKRGKGVPNATDQESRKLIFKNLFVSEKDAEIARIVWNYFKAVERRWPDAWTNVARGNILNRTSGFGALMRFLRPAYLSLAKPGELVAAEKFDTIFNKVRIKEKDFRPDEYKPGTSGESKLHNELLTMSGLNDS